MCQTRICYRYGFFVDRQIGLYIALYYNQIVMKHGPSDELFSEDLRKDNLFLVKKLNKYFYKAKNDDIYK